MKRIIVLALILLAMIGLFAANQTRLLARSPATATDKMRTASQLYEAGQYAQAAQAYQQLADQGFADSVLYYNLANAHFKQGDYGRAVLNYLRAERLDPRDSDVQANLELARAQTVDQLQVAERQSFFDVLSRASQSWLSLNGLAMVALAAWILVVFLVIVLTGIKPGGVWRKGVRNSLLLTAVVLAAGVLLLGTRLYAENQQSAAVVVAPKVAVASGPGAQYVTEFELHSGAEVDLLETRGSWKRLALPGEEGLEGWVPAAAIEAVKGKVQHGSLDPKTTHLN
jgi:tetratricopeptide (TPR) repeat protein